MAKDVSSNYNAITAMFQEMTTFLERFAVHLSQEISEPLKRIVIEILAQILKALGVVTKTIKKGQMGNVVNQMLLSALLIDFPQCFISGVCLGRIPKPGMYLMSSEGSPPKSCPWLQLSH